MMALVAARATEPVVALVILVVPWVSTCLKMAVETAVVTYRRARPGWMLAVAKICEMGSLR